MLRAACQSSAGASWQLSVRARIIAMRFIPIIMIVTRGAAFQAARGFASGVTGEPIASAPQHLLYFRPEPQGQGAQRAIGAGAGAGCWVGGAAGSVWWFRRSTAPTVTVETVKTRDLEAVVSASGKIQPKRFVNISSLAVYSNRHLRRHALLDETCPLETELVRRNEPYVYAKLKQDQRSLHADVAAA